MVTSSLAVGQTGDQTTYASRVNPPAARSSSKRRRSAVMPAGFARVATGAAGWLHASRIDNAIDERRVGPPVSLCARPGSVGGRHRSLSRRSDPWPEARAHEVLVPYPANDRRQFLASGLWESLARTTPTLPAGRFYVQCKFAVEGVMKAFEVRWSV